MLKTPIEQSKTILVAAFMAATILFAGACNPQTGPPGAPDGASPPTASAFQSDGGRFISTLQEQSRVGTEPDNGSNGTDDVSIIDAEGRSTSEINVEVSDLNQPVQQFYFSLDRNQHYVRVVDANARNTLAESGDVFVTLTVQMVDPQAFSSSGEVEAQSLTRLAIEYDKDVLRILEVDTANGTTDGGREVILDLSRKTTAPRLASIESDAKGALVDLRVEVLETLSVAESNNGSQPAIGGFATGISQDKPQRFIDLAGETKAGRVNVNVRIRGSDPECPPPCSVASLTPPEEDDTPPEETPPPSDDSNNESDSDQEPLDTGPEPQDGPESQAPQSGSEGSEGEDTDSESSPGNPPPQDDETPEGDAPDPNKPDGENVIKETNGDENPYIGFVDVMLVIDDSSSMLYYDPGNERIDAALTYLSTSLTGDQVGVTHFSNKIKATSLVRIEHGGAITPKGKQSLIDAIKSRIAVGTFTHQSLGLNDACDVLKAEGIYPTRAAILFTNDQATSGLSEGFVDPAQRCFEEEGWPIYVFALGNSDVESFEEIAAATGGAFTYFDDDLLSLVCEVQKVRNELAGGNSPPCTNRSINTAERLTLTAQVPPAQVQATFTVSWEKGGDMFIERVISPSGKTIYSFQVPPHVVRDSSDTYEIFSILNPEPGKWELVIKETTVIEEGEVTSPGETDIVFGISTIPVAP